MSLQQELVQPFRLADYVEKREIIEGIFKSKYRDNIDACEELIRDISSNSPDDDYENILETLRTLVSVTENWSNSFVRILEMFINEIVESELELSKKINLVCAIFNVFPLKLTESLIESRALQRLADFCSLKDDQFEREFYVKYLLRRAKMTCATIPAKITFKIIIRKNAITAYDSYLIKYLTDREWNFETIAVEVQKTRRFSQI